MFVLAFGNSPVEIILLATRHQDHFAIGVIWRGGGGGGGRQMPLQYFSYIRINCFFC